VEYALLTGFEAVQGFASQAAGFASRANWKVLGAIAAAFVAVWLATRSKGPTGA
jgi:hypothetical protein